MAKDGAPRNRRQPVAAQGDRKGLGQHRSGVLQRIHDDLDEAFAISRRLGRPDAIGAVGELLAQVLALAGERQPALQVLAFAEEACAQRSALADAAAAQPEPALLTNRWPAAAAATRDNHLPDTAS